MGQIIEKNVFMNSLKRERTVRIYLPTGYDGEKKYGVLYAMDGNQIYSASDNPFGNWKMDYWMDQLEKNTGDALIIVGIDNSSQRFDEYSPWKASSFVQKNGISSGGDGKKYASFIVDELKPLIDSELQTIKENAYLIGSSMGAFICDYIGISNPSIFKKVGSFSLASWFNITQFTKFVKNASVDINQGFYLTVGDKEGGNANEHNFTNIYLQYNQKFYNQLLEKKYSNVSFKIIPEGNHNEKTWSNEFYSFLLWLFE